MASSNLGGTNLGGGITGISPKQTVTNYKGSEQAMIRRQVVRSWNTQNATGVINNNNRVITPFRAVNNSGDFLSRKNYVCGGPNPNHLHRGGIRHNFRAILNNCDNTGVEAASTNVKYVYDHSDYIRYKKQEAMNHNYNDNSFGGYNNSAYVDIMRIRR
jgi:hypothetical protein